MIPALSGPPSAVRSGCKINLYLDVLGRRPDGYHDVVSVMEPLALFDRIVFQDQPRGIKVTCDHLEVPTGSGNLAWRAADLFRKETGVKRGVRIHIRKSVPPAAGLGGGSANAAAVLSHLNRRWGIGMTRKGLISLAAILGSDVPFFIRPRTSLTWGRGEKVAPLPAPPPFWTVMVKPPFGVSTAWAYSQLKPDCPDNNHPHLNQILAALQAGDLDQIGRCLFNVFEPMLRRSFPAIARLLDFFRSGPVLGALPAGSGPTTAAVVRTREEAEVLAERVRAVFPADWMVRSVPNRPVSIIGRHPSESKNGLVDIRC